jgi:hypothetical protein
MMMMIIINHQNRKDFKNMIKIKNHLKKKISMDPEQKQAITIEKPRIWTQKIDEHELKLRIELR